MPEGASTREKTKYASMLATLHQGISGIIGKNIDSVFVNSKEEIYDALIEKKTEEKQRTKDVRVGLQACEGGCSRGSRKGHPLSLKVSEAARASVEKLSGGEAAFNFVQLVGGFEKANDMSTETLNLEMTAFTEPDDIQHVLSSASPRYSIYSWTHLYNDSMVTSNTSTIKERMLYSSMCLSALSVIEQWIRIDKKIETDDLIDINKTMLYSILHPSVEKKDKLFLKPKRPGK
ncbi:hypothetical protein PORY_000721 [Pneumocystis oryctolagi]|uniref:Uncharacterized protein n=1 Tax=Pneumocystis oryctolagi TaxID=42067 RepID=A0ACB7CDT2_9ASCO|nr:hypothetical protein PORY_000721 [Pneumocystis oryctolagi]